MEDIDKNFKHSNDRRNYMQLRDHAYSTSGKMGGRVFTRFYTFLDDAEGERVFEN